MIITILKTNSVVIKYKTLLYIIFNLLSQLKVVVRVIPLNPPPPSPLNLNYRIFILIAKRGRSASDWKIKHWVYIYYI